MELRVMFEVPQAKFKEKDHVILPSGRPGTVIGYAPGLDQGRLNVQYTDDEGGMVSIWPKYLQADNRPVPPPPPLEKGTLECARCGNLFKRKSSTSKYCSDACYKAVSLELQRKRRLTNGNWVEI